MSDQSRLRRAAIQYTVLWTASMLWFHAPLTMETVIRWTIAGAIAGFIYYWGMRGCQKMARKSF
ncbi:MAG TPA: hypothetical protein VHL09_09700 [Dehalococcoidia bacterium]|nr:hypothetical protein [Dehalococcoidia bacterium]